MIHNNRKKNHKKLLETFGKLKNDLFDFGQIERYFKKKDNLTALQILSDKTLKDLDFEELFMFVDRTHSKVGQQYLYNKLRNIPLDSKENDLQER